jgi:multiple sugar transport system substrate-binding protein
MKKFLAIILCVVLSLALFAACDNGGSPATPDAPEAPAAADGDIELMMWHYFSSEAEDDALEMIRSRFMASHPGISVTITHVPRDDLLMQYTMGAVSGDLPDIGMVDNPDHASFSAMGVFEDITDLVDAWGEQHFFFEGPMMSAMYEGRVYGLPNNSNCLALFYNKDLLDEAGVDVPVTWDDLEAASAALTGGDVFGLAISAVNNEEGTFQFMPWFISAGGSIDDLGGPGPVRAVTYLNNLIEQGYMSRDVINWTQGDANMQFMNGRAAMQVNGPWNVPNILRDAPDLNWGVALIPRDVKNASVLGGENFAIGANPVDREAAFAFLSWYMSADILADWAEATGKFPPRSDSIQLKDIWTVDPIFSVFGEALQYAMPRGPHPRWPEISDAMSTAFHEVYTGVRSPEDAMATAAERYAALVAE